MSTTYVARAPITGPSTAEFPPVRDGRSEYPVWPPQHHRPLAIAAAAAAALALPLLIVYCFVAGDPDTARTGRMLLYGAALTCSLLTGGCLIAAVAVRANDRTIRQATEYGVAEVRDLESLHGELQLVAASLSATLAEYRQVAERIGVRVEAVERRVEEQDQEYERGWVDGAARTADALSGNGQVRQLHPSLPKGRR